MKIRSHLILLVVAVVAPVALLAAFSIERLWQLQRRAYEQQFLERVSALRLAQDTELDATRRTLRTLANVPDIDRELPAFVARFSRLLEGNPMWSTIGLVRPDGRLLARLDKAPLPANAVPDAATLRAAAESKDVVISDLLDTSDEGIYVTYLVAPVVRKGDRVQSILYIGVRGASWLEFLRRYPISKDATLTLTDRNGRIIARTLSHERWIGRVSGKPFLDRIAAKNEDTFISPGLEGQSFYTAFSRSRVSGWVIGTGVPQQEVEAALRGPTATTIGGVLAAALLATLLALVIGRRIAGALTSLAAAAKDTGSPEAPPPGQALSIVEAETVRRTLEESAVRLRAREASLSEALRNEGVARAEAERVSRAKDDFLAMLGHELRNPLSAISTASGLLQMSPPPDVAQRAREVLQRQVRHLTGILDDMLDVSRLTSGKVMLNRKTIDLAQAVQHVCASFRDSGRCAHLSLEVRCAPAPVFADETRLEQVIANLLDNACKYTPAGGRVVLEAGTEGGESVLRLSDSGSGIPPELLPHVFDIFAQGARTLDRAQGGLGLGLTVVRRLVELHGGTVSAASVGAERGTSVVVRLPRAADAVAAAATPAAAPAPGPRSIVLIEDNRDNRDAVAALLRLRGHEVTVAEDGARGLAAIGSARPEIALVDLGLPGIDGLEIARRVRSAGNGSRRPFLVALTGYGSERDQQLALTAGFDAYLIKPFDMAKFEAAVRGARL